MEKNKFATMEYIKQSFDKYKYILLICLLGILLTLIPGKSTAKKTDSTTMSEYISSAQEMETGLEELLSNIDGVGRVDIMITMRRGYEPSYIYNSSTSEANSSLTEKNELVIARGNAGDTPVISSVSSPEYMGAVVLCDGAGSATVQLEITEAIKSLTGITSDNIKISQMKK